MKAKKTIIFRSWQAPGGRRDRGFALVATISMLVLLTVVAMGLLSLSAVSIRSSNLEQAEMEARGNARMALMIAIGELQQVMGPDNRITARGVTMAKHPAVNADVPPNSAKAWWVGAASSDRNELIGSNPKPVTWLVSGLNLQATSADQIGSAAFMDREIALYGKNSIDLTLTAGEEITAGIVPITDQATGQVTGSYAYFIDDNGMKAQLAPARSDIINTEIANRKTGTVIPGAYDLSILDGMSGMQGVTPSQYVKLPSYNSLSLLASGGKQVARNKRMSYTTSSLGVLSDVKRGGLKKDLTIAFEKYTTSRVTKNSGTYYNMPSYPVFDSVFPMTSASEWGDYLLLDESRRGEFAEQGYIHWGMLRDFYNIKRYIRRENGQDCLAPIVISEWQMHGNLSGYAYAKGAVGPHAIGLSATPVPNLHRGMPYGDYRVVPNLNNIPSVEFIEYYKHSPLTPILGQLQYNCWIEKAPADPSLNPSMVPPPTEAIVVCAQMWGAHYNPYNIGLFASGKHSAPYPNKSFTFQYMPDPVIRVRDSQVKVIPRQLSGAGDVQDLQSTTTAGVKHWLMAIFFSQSPEGRRYTVNSKEMLGPGRAMFTAFENDFDARYSNGTVGYGPMVFGTDVKNLVTQSARRTFNVQGNLPPSLDWGIAFGDNGLFTHGVSHPGGGEWFACQFLFDAFPKSTPSTPNSQLYDYTYLPDSSYNDNSRLSFNMRLRSTREVGSSIRPLVDGNIRAFYLNRRWDQPLHPGMDPGLRMISAYEAVDSKSDATVERVPQMSTHPDGRGYSYWGAENTPFFGFDRVILFDIPREDLVSLGQLQHANIGRFSYEPSYIIGNSYANPRIPLKEWKTNLTDSGTGPKISGSYVIYDASYLANEALWDSYTFTTIPQVKDNYRDLDEEAPSAALFTDILRGEKLLPNPRHLPYEPPGSKFDMATLQANEAVHYNAGHLMVDGAFNVNSTSVDAWEAFLSGTHGMPYQKIDANGNITGFEAVKDGMVRFPRVQSVFGKEMKSDSADENYWVGFRALTQEEVRELAEAIVGEIRARGPFLSMADFVNRKLEMGEHGHMGALQAALDKTINANINSGFTLNATHPSLPPDAKQAAGFPGQLLQGDILQALAPCMTVRSDTFTIRAYGESINPSTGKVEAKAWCEATVQRYPDPISGSSSQPSLSELARPSSKFGRQFRVTSFRWLNPSEI